MDSVIGTGKSCDTPKKEKYKWSIRVLLELTCKKKQARSLHLNILSAPDIVGNSENQSSGQLKSRIIASRCKLY